MNNFLITRKEIADRLNISPSTLKKYITPFYNQVPFYFQKRTQLTPVEYQKLKAVLVNELGFPDELLI